MLHSDVIAAISTPPGKGGVAVIRVSGEGALAVANKIFTPASKREIASYPPRTQIYGYVLDSGEKIDDGMLTYFEENASYTGEETLEISCHGGILVTELVLAAVLSAGARLAEAGEFTRRAFLNGRLSLSEAEAIGLLLDAKSEEQIRLASKDSRERLNRAVGALSSKLTELLGSIYARIDYPDEDLGDFTDTETLEILKGALSDTERLLSTYKEGHSISEGITTAIVGRPNVGKSTLYNLLCGKDAAIVTDIAGTTRDVLEETVSLGRVMLRLSDTAGIRNENSTDEVEKIGIARSRERLNTCELVLAVFDASDSATTDDALLEELSHTSAVKIAIYNKIDKKQPDTEKIPNGFDKILCLSARDNPDAARDVIREAVEELFCDGKISLSDRAVIYSARQRAELTEARSAISSAIDALLSGVFTDAVSSDVEIALGAISRASGRAVSEAVVDNIFSRFCVGK